MSLVDCIASFSMPSQKSTLRQTIVHQIFSRVAERHVDGIVCVRRRLLLLLSRIVQLDVGKKAGDVAKPVAVTTLFADCDFCV